MVDVRNESRLRPEMDGLKMAEKSRLSNWKSVWERKGNESRGVSLIDLITADGFDGGSGKMDEKTWLARAENIKSCLRLHHADSLLEVGCGAGAMLLALNGKNIRLAGIDYSASLVALAKQAVPNADIRVSEAASIPYPDGSFSRLLSHGVFHYFPDEEYSKAAMREMLRVLKKGGGLLISDIPDLEKRDESEMQRRSMAGKEGSNYLTGSQGDYSHLYYGKGFFINFFKSCGLNASILEWAEEGYGNAKFRFHVSVWT